MKAKRFIERVASKMAEKAPSHRIEITDDGIDHVVSFRGRGDYYMVVEATNHPRGRGTLVTLALQHEGDYRAGVRYETRPKAMTPSAAVSGVMRLARDQLASDGKSFGDIF